MAEYERDPSANTGRFRAFVEQAQADERATRSPATSRGLLIGGVILAVIVIIIVIALAV
jgi:subtilase family serine protease